MEENNQTLENNIEQNTPIKVNLVNILILSMEKAFYFITEDLSLKEGDDVICETSRGAELGKVVSSPIEKEIQSLEEFPHFTKRATKQDLFAYEVYKNKAKEACKITSEEAKKLDLDMTVINADYTIDGTKIIIYYLSESRVDFRELLKNLATLLHCRIELRQIGTRDKAKRIGGIGICGLKLCCSTFLNEFDGISITMAKNQMLALNIPKLSGHCGKLICCLKFENDAYLDAQKDLPKVGLRVKYNDEVYKITSMNVITRMIRLETKENIITVPYDEIKDCVLPKDYAYNQQQAFQKKKQEEKAMNALKEQNIEIESQTIENTQEKKQSQQKGHYHNQTKPNNKHQNNNHNRFNKNNNNKDNNQPKPTNKEK